MYIQYEPFKFRNIVSFGRLVLFYFMQKRPERHLLLLLLLGTEEGGKNMNDGIRISGKKPEINGFLESHKIYKIFLVSNLSLTLSLTQTHTLS